MNAPAIVQNRLAKLESMRVDHGSHGTFKKGHCAMELVAWLANEPHSDSPSCACPVIKSFVIRWNDSIRDNDVRTEALRPLLPLIVGTKSTKAVEQRRGWICADWAVRESAPAWLDWCAEAGVEMSELLQKTTKSDKRRALAGEAIAAFEALKVHAIALRQLPELVDRETKNKAQSTIVAAREAAQRARSAASAAYAASAADAADAAYAADAADAADAAKRQSFKDRLDAVRSARIVSAQGLVRRLCAAVDTAEVSS